MFEDGGEELTSLTWARAGLAVGCGILLPFVIVLLVPSYTKFCNGRGAKACTTKFLKASFRKCRRSTKAIGITGKRRDAATRSTVEATKALNTSTLTTKISRALSGGTAGMSLNTRKMSGTTATKGFTARRLEVARRAGVGAFIPPIRWFRLLGLCLVVPSIPGSGPGLALSGVCCLLSEEKCAPGMSGGMFYITVQKCCLSAVNTMNRGSCGRCSSFVT